MGRPIRVNNAVPFYVQLGVQYRHKVQIHVECLENWNKTWTYSDGVARYRRHFHSSSGLRNPTLSASGRASSVVIKYPTVLLTTEKLSRLECRGQIY